MRHTRSLACFLVRINDRALWLAATPVVVASAAAPWAPSASWLLALATSSGTCACAVCVCRSMRGRGAHGVL